MITQTKLTRCRTAERLRKAWYTTGKRAEYDKHVSACNLCRQRHNELNAIAEAQQLRPDFDDALADWSRERGVAE